jgi:hypothetical protein
VIALHSPDGFFETGTICFLPSLTQLVVKITVAGRFDLVSARLAIENAQPAVRGCETRKHGEGGFKSKQGTFAVSQSGQSNTQIKMTQR